MKNGRGQKFEYKKARPVKFEKLGGMKVVAYRGNNEGAQIDNDHLHAEYKLRYNRRGIINMIPHFFNDKMNKM